MTTVTSHVSVHDDASRLSRLSESSDSNSRPGFSYSGMFYMSCYIKNANKYLQKPNKKKSFIQAHASSSPAPFVHTITPEIMP